MLNLFTIKFEPLLRNSFETEILQQRTSILHAKYFGLVKISNYILIITGPVLFHFLLTVFELVVRDFIISWYRDIGKDEDMFLDALE